MNCALLLVKSGPGRWRRRGPRPFVIPVRWILKARHGHPSGHGHSESLSARESHRLRFHRSSVGIRRRAWRRAGGAVWGHCHPRVDTRQAQRQAVAHRQRAELQLNAALRRREGRFLGIGATSAVSGNPSMSAIAEPFQHAKPDDNLARRNAMVLAVAQALAGGNNTVIVSTASIAGAVLAPDKGLATLPITAMVFGMWFGTLPLGALARHFGRRF